MKKEIKDNINPNHYKKGKIEVIDFIEDQKLDFCEGNVVKYLCRYRDKNGYTALSVSLANRNEDIVDLLKSYGAK